MFQQLRHISEHLREVGVAEKKDMKKLYTPARVYEVNLTNLLPIVYAVAKQKDVQVTTFSFPTEPAPGRKPKDVFATIASVYRHCAEYYSDRMGYQPVIINDINDKESFTPADVFDLTQIVLGELKGQANGDAKLDYALFSTYQSWASGRNLSRVTFLI